MPHQLVGEKLQVHAKDKLLEIFFQNKRIASHVRQFRHGMTTEPAHMPARHEKHHQWSAGRLMNWAKDVGDDVLIWVKVILSRKQHEQQAYRVCLGLLNLSRQYEPQRLNKACAIANAHQLYRLKQIRTILQSNQDALIEKAEEQLSLLPQEHENIRGPESFH
ncbi:MAG: hypothetical protein AB2660_17615 [Candidatus Thiodiazotropha sp.]